MTTMFELLASFWVDNAEEIGHKCACNGDTCDELARYLVPWPGREPIAQCQGHYEHTLRIADVFEMRETIRLGSRPLDVVNRRLEDDPSAARFAAMELL